VPDPEPRLGEPLPHADRAFIDAAKLIRYSLDPENPHGRHKAAVFKAVLQIEKSDWEYLRDAILDVLGSHPVSSVRQADRPEKLPTFGVRLPVRGKNGRWGVVITAWKIVDGRPELASARMAKRPARRPDDGSTI
jgi:hypothetical protein